jgi:L-idonate 5-dehydrogenase
MVRAVRPRAAIAAVRARVAHNAAEPLKLVLAEFKLGYSTRGVRALRACVVHGAGDLRVDEVVPAEPGPGQVAVDMAFGGICGTDLHYYHDGRVGDFRVVEPMIVGHEVAGRVASAGDGAVAPPAGTPVAIHPATPCDVCRECRDGHRNLCAETRYLGSAARVPHVQGGFAERIVVPAAQVRPLPSGLSLRVAALTEPLSVALHAVRRAGDVRDRRVLVTGAGPIGCLVVAALRQAGAAEIIVSDLVDEALALARRVGATTTVRAGAGDGTWPETADVAIEASGAPAGLADCVRTVCRGGTVVMLGMLPPGEVGLLASLVVTRELNLAGAFRFDTEFDAALALLASGLDVEPVITHTVPLADARAAFDLAGDRTSASKILLDLAP